MLRVTVETLRHFNWNKFSIVYMQEFFTMAETLEQLALKRGNFTVNHKMVATNREQFPNIIFHTKNSTRSEYPNIILCSKNSTRCEYPNSIFHTRELHTQ